jgi:hypothetical protein
MAAHSFAKAKATTKFGTAQSTTAGFMVDSFIKSRHWANYTLKQAGLPKTF